MISLPARARVIAPVLALSLTLALTGCGKPGAHGSDGSNASPVVAPTPASTAASPAASPDAATLDGISQDLGDAGDANGQADANARSGDQAAGTGDEP